MWEGAGESEVDRLNKLINFYEEENLRLKTDAEQANHKVEAMKEFNRNEDKRFHGLQKKIQTMEANIRLENRASEGTRKKLATLDIECQLLKEQDKIWREESIIHRRKVKEYEDTLCDDRAKRLKDMHECDLLRKKNAELDGRVNVLAADAVKARSDLLEKLQKLDSALVIVENQSRTIDAQGEEMLSLNCEVSILKETIQGMGESIIRLEKIAAERTAEKDFHELEAMRLRTEIVTMAQTHGERSIAYGNRIGSSQSRSRPGTGTGNGPMRTPSRSGGSFTFDGPSSPSGVSFGVSTVFDESTNTFGQLSSPMLSPIATRGRPKSQGGFDALGSSSTGSRKVSTPLPPPALKRNIQLPGLDTSFPDIGSMSGEIKLNNENVTIMTSLTLDTPEVAMHGEQSGGIAEVENKHTDELSFEPKSMKGKSRANPSKTKTSVANKSLTLYVGQGLGYKSAPIPQNHASAKQILRNILIEFQNK